MPRNPTWQQFVAVLSGPVRELSPGDRPKDWSDEAGGALVEAEDESLEADPSAGSDTDGGVVGGGDTDGAAQPVPGALAPNRYKVQFTATQEYVDLLEEARDLLSHAVSGRSLEQVHLQAMRLLVTQLRKRRYADSADTDTVTDTETETSRTASAIGAPAEHPAAEPRSSHAHDLLLLALPRQRGKAQAHPGRAAEQTRTRAMHSVVNATTDPRQRGRYISAAVRRAVWKRDGGRCAYVDAAGRRCRETAFLEWQHKHPYARGGPPTESNVELLCAAHNALAAEHDFGCDFMNRKKGTELAP